MVEGIEGGKKSKIRLGLDVVPSLLLWRGKKRQPET